MRAYRQIAKNNSYLAAVSSGQSQAASVIQASLFSVYIWIKVNGTMYQGTHKMSANMVMELQGALDEFYFSASSSAGYSSKYGLPFSSKVSLHTDKSDPLRIKPYHSLGDLYYNFAEYQQLGIFKTLFKSKPITVKESGVIKSAGLSVVTDNATDQKALLSMNERRVRYPTSLMINNSNLYVCNMYYKPNKCFYCFTGTQIIKIPFDLDNFGMGTPITLFNDFGRVAYNETCGTDLDHLVCARYNDTVMKVFDCKTETVKSFSAPAGNAFISGYRMAWDAVNNVFRFTGYIERFVSPNTYQYYGFTFNPYTGAFAKNTGRGAGSSNAIYITEDVIIASDGIYKNNLVPGTGTAPTIQLTANSSSTMTNMPTLINDEGFYVYMLYGQFIFGTFPANYVAIADLPDIPVNAGDVVEVQYEYRIGESP